MYSIQQHCIKLLKEKVDDKSRISCKKCGLNICAGKKERSGNRSVQSTPAITHACSHLGIQLFACRYCSYQTFKRAVMEFHVADCHKLDQNPKNYISLVGEKRKEIIAMIESCFGQMDSADCEPKFQSQKEDSTDSASDDSMSDSREIQAVISIIRRHQK